MLPLIALVTLYVAWMAWTHSAKHQEAVWGYSWAARFAASTCRAIASFCGMRLTVVYDGFDGDKLEAEHRGLVAAVGPHGVFPCVMLGLGAFKFRADSGHAEAGLVDLSARFAGACCEPGARKRQS